MRVRKYDAVRNVRLGKRGGVNLSGKVTGLVGVTFSSASAAAEFEAHVVLGEDVCQALDFAGVWNGKQHLVPGSGELLNLFEHCRNRTMKARCGLRQKLNGGILAFAARDSKMFKVRACKRSNLLPPGFRRKIKVRGTN